MRLKKCYDAHDIDNKNGGVMKFLVLMMCWAASLAASAAAPKPLYRDPVYDGAADASIVYDHAARLWKMFYTNRRATLKLADPKDVAWVHGTAIGIATSADGSDWRYQGTAQLPAECTSVTSWAPELYYENGVYHMWLTVVPGIFHRWGVPGAEGRIVHLTSHDLQQWACDGKVEVGASRIIDASVLKLGERYRMWYKDETAGSVIMAADSSDLRNWSKAGAQPVSTTRAEGPKVFRFKGQYWMVADAWKGLMVLRSDDAEHWTQQSDYLLARHGAQSTDKGLGQHPDVVVDGERAYIYYFVHQGAEPQAAADPYWQQRTVIQVAELLYQDGKLTVDRNAPVTVGLSPPQ
jgi:hypothetical protein